MRAMIWLVGAWAMFAVSWFLPVAGEGTTTLPKGLPGWEALTVALSTVSTLGTPEGASLLPALTAVTNLVMIGSVVAVRKRSRRGLAIVGWAAGLSWLIDAYWLVGFSDLSLRVGYFLWWWSFLPLAIGAFRLRRSITAHQE